MNIAEKAVIALYMPSLFGRVGKRGKPSKANKIPLCEQTRGDALKEPAAAAVQVARCLMMLAAWGERRWGEIWNPGRRT